MRFGVGLSKFQYEISVLDLFGEESVVFHKYDICAYFTIGVWRTSAGICDDILCSVVFELLIHLSLPDCVRSHNGWNYTDRLHMGHSGEHVSKSSKKHKS